MIKAKRFKADIYLRKKTERFVELLRWQHNARGPFKIFRTNTNYPIIYWKTENGEYQLAPMRYEISRASGFPGGGLLWGKDDREKFNKLWSDDKAEEPLGHQLLREAKHMRHKNSRGALLIAYSALEVGLKRHISVCAPDAAWLVENAPIPPVFKILKNYLPKLHRNNPCITEWGGFKKESKFAQYFAEDRNELVHSGKLEKDHPDRGKKYSLDYYLKLTENLLYAFDVLEGHEWAKARVSNDFRNAVGWDDSLHEVKVR